MTTPATITLEAKPYSGTREVSAYLPTYETKPRGTTLETKPYLPTFETKPYSGLGEIPDTPNLWAVHHIIGAELWGADTFPSVAAAPSLWNRAGSPTAAQQFLFILNGAIEGARSYATEVCGTNIGAGFNALYTALPAEDGFHASATVRIHIESGHAVRGPGGAGGKGACELGGGKVSQERVGGGGGGAGAQTFYFSDPGVRVGGTGGLNACNIPGGPHGATGERETGGLGNDSLILSGVSATTPGTNGVAGMDAIVLDRDVEIVNEGSIYGGGGGGGGAWTDGTGNISYPGDGGTPGTAGADATIKTGAPTIYTGGAAGKAIQKNGHDVTWLNADGTPGNPGDVLGDVS